MRVVYWFKRDLRTHDNRGLVEAYMRGDEVHAVYVFDRTYLSKQCLDANKTRLSFLVNALENLSKEIPLNIFIGDVEEVFDHLLSRFKYSAVYTSTSLSWSDENMAIKVKEICKRHGVEYVEVLDNVLSNPYLPHPTSNFTLFYKSWIKSIHSSMLDRPPPRRFKDAGGLALSEIISKLNVEKPCLEQLSISWGLNRLRSFHYEKYDKLRNYPYTDGVSRLSHFISLGTLSIREIYNVAKDRSQEFVRQLAWREYYYTLWVRFPWMNELELKPYMRGLVWENDKYLLKCFIEGKTGYPIIDAGIRQLKMEGWIHNRVRLIMANFLVKDLHVDWSIGVDFFKKTLVDYDETLNVGNWQWAASVGVDPLPLRLFNPIKQSEKYDPHCLYIKKYIPELKDCECKSLHNPLAYRIKEYYEPVVDHYEAIRKYAEMVRRHVSSWKTSKEKTSATDHPKDHLLRRENG